MVMKKIDTRETIASTPKKGMEKAKHSGVNVSEDGFTVVQSFGNLNTVIITAENSTGNRPANIKMTGTVVILRHQEGTLDVLK